MNRIYHDFFLPDQTQQYYELLLFLKDEGYEFYTVRDFESIVSESVSQKKCCVLRRDVDTLNDKALKEMFSIEHEVGARCTYYFRLRTLNPELMRQIESGGGEASYHYEEISDCIKKYHLRSKEKVYEHMKEIREEFSRNLTYVRKVSGLPCVTVASHGEWPNRRLKVPNLELMTDSLRVQMGILREAYDEEAMRYIEKRFADQTTDDVVTDIINYVNINHPQKIYILTHPAQWRADIYGSLLADTRRLFEEIQYRFCGGLK